jgi:hypothetical protein
MIQEKDYLEAKNIVAAYKKQNSKLVSFELTRPNVGSWNVKLNNIIFFTLSSPLWRNQILK